MKVVMYQMDIIPGKPKENCKKVENWADKVCNSLNPDILVLPEMWTTAYTLTELETIIQELDTDIVLFLQGIAKKHKVNLVAGSIAVKENGKVYNRALVIDRHGELIYQYDKIHLVPMLKEHLYLDGGKEAGTVFELDGYKMGLMICYDLRFPELARSLALQGAEIIFVVAEWPSARELHWNILQKARAIENQVFVASCNRVGIYDGVEFAGQSQVITPWGESLFVGSSSTEETLTTSLDMSTVKKIRSEVPVFNSRVPSLYKHQ